LHWDYLERFDLSALADGSNDGFWLHLNGRLVDGAAAAGIPDVTLLDQAEEVAQAWASANASDVSLRTALAAWAARCARSAREPGSSQHRSLTDDKMTR
jgi:hypothetical protein